MKADRQLGFLTQRRGEAKGRRVAVGRVRRFADCIDVGAVLARDERGGGVQRVALI